MNCWGEILEHLWEGKYVRKLCGGMPVNNVYELAVQINEKVTFASPYMS